MSLTREAPPLTVAVATGQGWEAVRHNVRTWERAAAAVGGDVVVADGSGDTPPDTSELSRHTTWLRRPGESVFALRVAAYGAARGDIIAVTEDHCRVPEDWAERMLAAHRANPSAAAVGGSVLNGATSTLLDWASFLVVQTDFVAPIPSGPVGRLNGVVNVSYKREELAVVDDHGGLGAVDVFHQGDLVGKGGRLIADDSIRVVHDQHLDLAEMTAMHFHAGRTMGGFRRRRMQPRDYARVAGVVALPLVRLPRYVRTLVSRGYGRRVALSAPLMTWLLYAHVFGQFVGYILGPGDSPHRLQ